MAHLIAPGQLTELRAVEEIPKPGKAGQSKGGDRRDHRTWAGKFVADPADHASLGAMAAEAMKITDRRWSETDGRQLVSGVYFAPNPVRPECRRRQVPLVQLCDNRSRPVSDRDILARRWVVIDVDPVRPAKTNATDAEKLAAKRVADAAAAYLAAEFNGVEPIVADSGNGYHLFYRLAEDVPVDPDNLPRQAADPMRVLLHTLADKFDTDAAKIDRSVYNPGRIFKLPGTVGRKGEHTTERPHRRSGLLSVPTPGTPSLTWADVVRVAQPGIDKINAERQAFAEKAARDAVAAAKAGGRGKHADIDKRAAGYAANTPGAVQGQNGSDATLFLCSRLVWGLGLTPERALPVVLDWNTRCVPPWERADLVRKLGQIMTLDHERPFGHLLNAPLKDRPGYSKGSGFMNDGGTTYAPGPGDADVDAMFGGSSGAESPPAPDAAEPPEGDMSPSHFAPEAAGVDALDPRNLAETLLLTRYRVRGDIVDYRLIRHQGSYYEWRAGAYRRLDDECIGNIVTRHAENEAQRAHVSAMESWQRAEAKREGSGGKQPVRKKVTRTVVGDVVNALSHRVTPDRPIEAPCWLADPTGCRPDPRKLIPTTRGIINLVGGEILPITPALFVLAASDDYDPDAPPPEPGVLEALADALTDPESLSTAQEFLGYLYTQDTSKQRFLFLQGPPGGGKGTFVTLMSMIVGTDFVAATSFHDLSTDHGAADLVGKSLATMADTVVGARTDVSAGVMRFLNITGEDAVSINPKNRPVMSARLAVRFVVAANELPAIRNAGTALASRALVLRFGKKFRGTPEEDTTLRQKIARSRKGLFKWGLEGAFRLEARGHFVQPESGAEVLRDFTHATSPLTQFVDQQCIVDPDAIIIKADLYEAYREWCRSVGHATIVEHSKFGTDLKNIVLDLKDSHKRDKDDGGSRKPTYKGIRLRGLMDEIDAHAEYSSQEEDI